MGREEGDRPYVNAEGKPLTEGGGTTVLEKNSRWLEPGGESLLMNSHGEYLIVSHAYDATTGKPSMQLSTIDWKDRSPHAALEN